MISEASYDEIARVLLDEADKPPETRDRPHTEGGLHDIGHDVDPILPTGSDIGAAVG